MRSHFGVSKPFLDMDDPQSSVQQKMSHQLNHQNDSTMTGVMTVMTEYTTYIL